MFQYKLFELHESTQLPTCKSCRQAHQHINSKSFTLALSLNRNIQSQDKITWLDVSKLIQGHNLFPQVVLGRHAARYPLKLQQSSVSLFPLQSVPVIFSAIKASYRAWFPLSLCTTKYNLNALEGTAVRIYSIFRNFSLTFTPVLFRYFVYVGNHLNG